MKKKCDHRNPLQRDGRSQSQRVLTLLDPKRVKLDDRSVEDLLSYAYRYAAHLKYFDDNNQDSGENWQAFWSVVNEKALADIKVSAKNEPHFALFLCFLHLFSQAQKQMNTLTGKHLDFYYQRVLQLKKKPARADRVHLIFELAKNARQQMLEAGTALKAGKDATGVERQYIVTEDTLVSKAQVELMRSVYRKGHRLYFAAVANSQDGLGELPVEPGEAWSAFGGEHLPVATIGFALASPVLSLSEGQRKVTLRLGLSNLQPLRFTVEDLREALQVQFSGEEAWLGPFELGRQTALKVVDQSAHHYNLELVVQLSGEVPAIVPFDDANLDGDFNTTAPVARVVLKDTASQSVVSWLDKASLRSLQVDVSVRGMEDLILENDNGGLNPAKAFMPFGPQPQVGTNFYIGSEEAFTKNLQSFDLDIRWQNLPTDGFSSHYADYRGSTMVDPFNVSVSNNSVFKAQLTILNKQEDKWTRQRQLFNSNKDESGHTISVDFSREPVSSSAVLNALRLVRLRDFAMPRFKTSHLLTAKPGRWMQNFEQRKKFIRNIDRRRRVFLARRLQLRPFKPNPIVKEGFVSLSLLKDFGHKVFPKVLTSTLMHNANTKNESLHYKLPNEPYTPLMASLRLNYRARTQEVPMDAKSQSLERFEQREIQYFHLRPFGHSEEHSYLKANLPFDHSTIVTALPSYASAGALYLGLKDIVPGQELSILLQLDEGTAKADKAGEKVSWSILASDHWLPLSDKSIVADHTNQLLATGIFKLLVPKEATDDNTILDDGYYWLRATVPQHIDAVCQFVGVHTQAVPVQFRNRGNDPNHLATPLAAETISKLVHPLQAVKKIKQPYDSFGGKMIEDANRFYTRVSERLRHKNRAVSIWDYEHLLLEEFPELYKVKCLNHTSANSEMAPGYVTIIAIPSLRNRRAADSLQPKVSSKMLEEIRAFLQGLASDFVTINVENPSYESIELEFSVAFNKSLEFGYYRNKLNQDLIRFLTPWAFEEGKDLDFSGSIHKSVVMHFIDNLPYVDVVSHFSMYQQLVPNQRSKKKDIISDTTSKSILVSVAEHSIKPINDAQFCS